MNGRCLRPCRRALKWISLAAVIVFFTAVADSYAGREVRLKIPSDTSLPFATPVVSPQARLITVNDTGRTVVTSLRPKQLNHLSFHKLDEQGQPMAGEPISLALPKPASLSANVTAVLGLVSHPRLPIVYVWQDSEPGPNNTLIEASLTAEFDHLFIYSVAEAEPKLLLSAARGSDYASGTLVSGFAINATGTRLYVPNMQRPDQAKKMQNGIGWIVLDADGLPAFDPPDMLVDASPDGPAVSVTALDWPAATASQTAKLAAIEQAKAAAKPLIMRRYLEVSWTFQTPPSPYCYAPLNDNIVFATTHSGAANWILNDRLGRFSYFYVQPYVPYRYRIAVHPTAPSAYIVPVIYDGRMLRIEHADGYFTLLPQTLLVENSTVYHSTPIVLPKTNQVAVGANGKVCFMDLEADGRFKGTAVQIQVNNPTVEGLAWSEMFGRLYFAVEKQP